MPIEYPIDSQSKGAIEQANFAELKSLKFKGGLPLYSTTPTHTGIQGEMALTDNGTTKQICYYLDGAWQCITLIASASATSKVRAYLSTNQVITNPAIDKIAFNTKSWDTKSEFNTSTYTFTPTTEGYYVIHLKLYDDTTNNSRVLRIYKNGANYSASRNLTTGYTWEITDMVYLNGTTDYVDVRGDSFAADINVKSGADATVLTIFKV